MHYSSDISKGMCMDGRANAIYFVVTHQIHEASSFSNSSCLWMTFLRIQISSGVNLERSGEGGSSGLFLPEKVRPERTDFD